MVANNQDHSRRQSSPCSEVLSPGGRPLNYQGSQGWAARITNRTVCAAAVGAVAGLGIGIIRRQSPIRWFRSLGTNCAVATCCFCGAQELVRELRAANPDDWVNSLLGGLGSGALLGRLHGGPARALPGALLFASVGTGLHLVAFQLKVYRLQHFLASLPREEGLDESQSNLETRPFENGLMRNIWSSWELPEWFPIKKLDEEALKKRAQEKELQRQKTVDGLDTRDFPMEDH